MSRGQKPRTPENFPRMKYRAYDRRKVMVLAVDGLPGAEVYGMFWARRRDVPKDWIMIRNPFTPWELSDGDPFDASAWLDGAL